MILSNGITRKWWSAIMALLCFLLRVQAVVESQQLQGTKYGRLVVNRTKPNSLVTRVMKRLCFFALFFLMNALPWVHASIESTDLRDLAAATLLGPFDLFVRGGADIPQAPATTIEAPTRTAIQDDTKFFENTTDATEEEIVHNITRRRQTTIVRNATDRFVFSLFQEGDGSESDPDGIPTRYLKMQLDHREHAAKALKATLKWRQEHEIDHILSKPHSKYDVCKQIFPHYFAGRDKEGHVVFVQRPALIDLVKGHSNNLTNEDLLMHYVYVNEYLWQVLEASKPLGKMTSIIDLTGLDFGILKKTELVGFVKKFVSTMDAHFPQRAHRTLILNSPKWFNVLYKIFSPLLRESTKAKIEIHSRGKKQDAALKKYLGDNAKEVLPASFWSKKEAKNMDESVPVSELEEELRLFALARLEDSGAKMQAFV